MAQIIRYNQPANLKIWFLEELGKLQMGAVSTNNLGTNYVAFLCNNFEICRIHISTKTERTIIQLEPVRFDEEWFIKYLPFDELSDDITICFLEKC